MKRALQILSVFLLAIPAVAQNKNLPSPNGDIATLPAGSYVIAMDNNLQTNALNHFNLKTYGLVIHLLNNNVKLKWVIRSGKAKDGIDLQGNAEIIQPTYTAASSRGFRAGPFVIYAADTTGVAALVTSFYTTHGLTGNDRPKVYRTTVAIANVDIRFTMDGFKPKVLILNDGGNQTIHEGYMTKCAVTSTNYAIGPATTLITRCYTFASEPHHEGPTNAVVAAVRHFVEYGGNFLAQCAAVETFENHSLGHFHSTNGISISNTNVPASSVTYPNPDLPFTQYQGVYSIHQGGSVRNWQFAFLSVGKNNQHAHAQYSSLLGGTSIGASVAKLTGAVLPGGLVFYLGSHEFSSVTAIESINGIRMYMNAVLTPVGINSNCATGAVLPNPLPVKLFSFNAQLEDEKVNLKWETASEINFSHFVVERSVDGIQYQQTGTVNAKEESSEINKYSFTDHMLNTVSGMIYYRLRSVDIDGKNEVSHVRMVRIPGPQTDEQKVLIYPNPVINELRLSFPANMQNRKMQVEIFSSTGIRKNSYQFRNVSQTESLDLSQLPRGIYIIRVSCEETGTSLSFIKQ